MSDKKLAAIAQNFQREMEKRGLAVSIKINQGAYVDVTVECPHCQRAA